MEHIEWARSVAAGIAAAHPLEQQAQPNLRFQVQIKRGSYVHDEFEAEGPDSLTVAHSFDALRGPGQYIRVVALPGPRFVASEASIAGNPLYFTGIENFTLVNSPWLSHAKVFATAEEAQAAVDPWNALGHKFVVGPKPEESATEYAQRRARENDRRALELQVNDPFVR